MPRVRGYHYVRGKDGRKRRVYGARSGKSYGYSRRKASVFGRVYGRGAYYTRKRPLQGGGKIMVNRPSTGRSSRGRGIALVFNGTDPPKMSMGRNGVVVEHREYIQDITSSTPFILENFPLNPGIKQTFPWLSQIADNFEEWIPEGILFEYKTTSSNTVVNTTNSNPGLGTVIIATQYNSLNGDFGNKQQMENYENAVSVDPSRSVIHPIETTRKQTPLDPMYVRTGAVGSQDLRWYDLGKTSVATVGQQTNNFTIGELWITYKIRFLKPRLTTGVGNNEQGVIDHITIYGNSGASVAGIAGVLPPSPFGTQTELLIPPKEGSTLGGVVAGGVVPIANQKVVRFPPSLGGPAPFPIFGISGGIVDPTQVDSAANTYYFPPGITSGLFLVTYLAEYANVGVPAVQVTDISANGYGCQLERHLGFDVAAQAFTDNLTTNSAATTTSTDMISFFCRVTTNYARFNLHGTAGMTAPTQADLFVMQLPDAFQ